MKKIYLSLLVIGAVIFSTETVQSQNTEESVKVKVFDESQNYFEPGKKVSLVKDKNYLRLNPYLGLRGAFVLGYERVLHPKHTVSIDAGFTYRDFIYEIMSDMFEAENVQVGHYADFSYKFYPKGYNNFEGPYLSPGILNRKYNLSSDVYLNGSTQNVDASYSMTEMYFKFGYLAESLFFSDMIFDIYAGAGIRNITSNLYNIESRTNSSTQFLQTYRETKQVPAIYCGVRIGIPF